jgi:hypothetical protein
MNTAQWSWYLLSFSTVFAFLMTSCGRDQEPPEAILGTWASSGAPLYEVYEFTEDGMVLYSLLNSQASEGATSPSLSGEYEILEGSMLVMRLPSETRIFGISISGDQLTMKSPTVTAPSGTQSRGPDYEFRRVE